MKRTSERDLSRRERQIMDAVYRLGSATAVQIMENMPTPPTYAAVRRMIAILEEKGLLRHEQDGIRYVYFPTVDRSEASRNALLHLTRTFFGGSPVDAVAALLDASAGKLSEEDLARLTELIEESRKEGR